MERWLDKVSNSSHLVTNLKKEALANIKKIKINQRKGRKNKLVTKAKVRVDNILKSPILNITFFRLLFLGLPSLTKVWLG